jgi:hypothetical protein
LIDEIPHMGDVLNVNRHFAAQYTQCPFCSMPFDIVGSKENFEFDLRITFENTNLMEQIDDITLATNSRLAAANIEDICMQFFSKIPKRLIQKIYNYYELDFDMFGYNKTDALKYIEYGLDLEEDSHIS